MQESMKAKDEALAAVEKEKIKEKKGEIQVMEKRYAMLCKKHGLIQAKKERMEDFDKFILKVQKNYPDDFSEKTEALTRYYT